MDCVVGGIAFWRDCVLAGLRVGGTACWRDCGSWVVGIATRIAGSGIACVSAGLSVVQDCEVGGIACWRDCRRVLHVVGLQDCRQWVVGIVHGWDCVAGGIAGRGIAARGIACGGLCVCRRL